MNHRGERKRNLTNAQMWFVMIAITVLALVGVGTITSVFAPSAGTACTEGR